MGGGHHFPDRLDLDARESMRRGVRTRRLIVEGTRGLPSEPTRRQTQPPENRAQRDTPTRTIHGAQDPPLGRSLAQTLAGEPEPETSSRASANRSRAASFSTRRWSFTLSRRSSGSARVRLMSRDHGPRRRAKPSMRHRARDSEIGRDRQVAGASNEVSEPTVIALLRARRGRHRE